MTAPLAAKVTVPLAGCTTLVTEGVPSNESAVAPPVPASTLNVAGVSSVAAMVSSVMSTTAVTVMPTVDVVVTVPSLVATLSVVAPFQSAAGA